MLINIAPKSERKEYIYFIASDELKMVKIGYTTNVVKRFGEIEQASPTPLYIPLVIKGDKKKEKELHSRFSKYRSHREWFRFEDELLNYIHKKVHYKRKAVEQDEMACDCDCCIICDMQAWKNHEVPITKLRRMKFYHNSNKTKGGVYPNCRGGYQVRYGREITRSFKIRKDAESFLRHLHYNTINNSP